MYRTENNLQQLKVEECRRMPQPDIRLKQGAVYALPNGSELVVGIGGRDVILKPDAFVRLGSGPFEDSWWLEVDLATESSTVLKRQCQAYLSYLQTGREQHVHGVFPRVLWIVPDKRRGDLLKRAISTLPATPGELFVITLQACLVDVLAPASIASEATS